MRFAERAIVIIQHSHLPVKFFLPDTTMPRTLAVTSAVSPIQNNPKFVANIQYAGMSRRPVECIIRHALEVVNTDRLRVQSATDLDTSTPHARDTGVPVDLNGQRWDCRSAPSPESIIKPFVKTPQAQFITGSRFNISTGEQQDLSDALSRRAKWRSQPSTCDGSRPTRSQRTRE